MHANGELWPGDDVLVSKTLRNAPITVWGCLRCRKVISVWNTLPNFCGRHFHHCTLLLKPTLALSPFLCSQISSFVNLPLFPFLSVHSESYNSSIHYIHYIHKAPWSIYHLSRRNKLRILKREKLTKNQLQQSYGYREVTLSWITPAHIDGYTEIHGIDLADLELPPTIKMDFPNPDDILNFNLKITPDEGTKYNFLHYTLTI